MQTPAQEQMDELTRYISGEILAGASDPQIVGSLMQQGWAQGDAESAVRGVRATLERNYGSAINNIQPQQPMRYPQPGYDPERAARRDAGKKKIVVGALFFVSGIVVTVATLAAAANGGTYVVAWGAILFGFIDMIIGLSMLR